MLLLLICKSFVWVNAFWCFQVFRSLYDLHYNYIRRVTVCVLGSSGTDNIVWAYMGPILSATFSALWVLPLFVLSKVVNGFWFQARAVFFIIFYLNWLKWCYFQHFINFPLIVWLISLIQYMIMIMFYVLCFTYVLSLKFWFVAQKSYFSHCRKQFLSPFPFLFDTIFYCNNLWWQCVQLYVWITQDIADAAYRKRRGRPHLPGLGKAIADMLFSLLLQGLFLIQVNIIPEQNPSFVWKFFLHLWTINLPDVEFVTVVWTTIS